MPFKKGKSGNINGRPIGSRDKQTSEIKAKFQVFFESNLNQLQSSFDELDGKDKLKTMLDLAPYFMPKLKQTEIIDISTDEEEMILTLDDTVALVEQLYDKYGMPKEEIISKLSKAMIDEAK
jgi:hypothetical protein